MIENFSKVKFKRKEEQKEYQRISSWSEYLWKSKADFEVKYWRKRNPACVNVSDFEVIRTVGTGWYGRVALVRHAERNTVHALKIIEKATVVQLNQVEHMFSEKRIFQAVDFPFTVHLQFYFMDNSNIYFVMPFIVGGELFMYLRKEGKFSEKLTKFYAAQIILVLEYLHYFNVVYRDLKPENILVNKDGYLKVTDFGFSKVVEGRTFTICGTPEYFAPEMVTNTGYGRSVDWWSLGVLIYEMSCGYSPFYTPNPNSESIFKRISRGSYCFPTYFSQELREVCRGLLEVNLWRRIQGQRLKDLPWFRSILWIPLLNRDLPAPFIPYAISEADPSNYETFEEKPIYNAPVEEYSDIFQDF